jgi:hypothetical protein
LDGSFTAAHTLITEVIEDVSAGLYRGAFVFDYFQPKHGLKEFTARLAVFLHDVRVLIDGALPRFQNRFSQNPFQD